MINNNGTAEVYQVYTIYSICSMHYLWIHAIAVYYSGMLSIKTG